MSASFAEFDTATSASARALEKSLAGQLEAVAELIVRGEVLKARTALQELARTLTSLPGTRGARELRARAKAERARLGWYAAGLDASSTLPGAFELALAARRELGEIPPPSVRAELGALIAGIACDMGDGASLDTARAVVGDCRAALLAEGATVAAAPLLVARAALELRCGHRHAVSSDLDLALELLGERVDAPNSVSAAVHMADARHLLGRLPLHGRVTGGSREEMIATALDHCRLAEATYAELGRKHEIVRVLDTTARLEALRARTPEARALFERALIIADDIADIIGLARATAGLAELLATTGSPSQAMTLLATSIELNREKGSRIGLVADEMVLARLDETFARTPLDSMGSALLGQVHAKLAEAIAETG